MNPELQKIHDSIQQDSKKFIKLRVELTNKYVERPNVASKSSYPSYIFLEDINSTGMDLPNFLNSLVKQYNSPLIIEVRRSHGSTSKSVKEHPVAIRYQLPETPQPQQNTAQMNTQYAPVQQQVAPQLQQPQNQNFDLSAGMNAQTMFLSDLKTKANESERNLKDYYKECEKTLQLQGQILELQKEHKKELEKLNAINIDLQTFKNTAVREMELEKQAIEKNARGFGDSEMAKQTMIILPEILAAITNRQAPPAQTVHGQNAVAPQQQLSEIKTKLINNIIDPEIKDSVIDLLDRAAGGLLSIDPFVVEFMDLLEKHNI